jgi:hypothetical protein
MATGLAVLAGAWVPSALTDPVLAVAGPLMWACALGALVAFCTLSDKTHGAGGLSHKVRWVARIL